VTDADLVLGHIRPDNFAGRLRLRSDLAEEAIRRGIADALFGGDALAAAVGIRLVVDNQMADLIRRTTLERGQDPRRFVLMAYGGAGPVHAVSYAAEAGIGRVVVPYFATVHSAHGATGLDLRHTLASSEPAVLPGDPARIEEIFRGLETGGHKLLTTSGVPPEHRVLARWVEARYRRQVHVLRVDAPEIIDTAGVEALARRFEAAYEKFFGPGTAYRDAGIELVNYGVEAVGRTEKPPLEAVARGNDAPVGRRPAWCLVRRAMVETPVYDGPGLPGGARFEGPAVIDHPGTSIVVPTGWRVEIDAFGNTHVISPSWSEHP
jgi:N-methylhydantoinase A